jgi:hypothetical protein
MNLCNPICLLFDGYYTMGLGLGFDILMIRYRIFWIGYQREHLSEEFIDFVYILN